jgi:hypothetical protein
MLNSSQNTASSSSSCPHFCTSSLPSDLGGYQSNTLSNNLVLFSFHPFIMAILTSCSILHALGHFCGNIHLRHPFFCDMNQQYWITSSRRFEVAYGFTFKVQNVPSLDNSWTFLPLKMIHCVVSRRREWMPQPHRYKV